MPKLIIEGVGKFDIPAGKKLLNALVENGGDPRYRCGGGSRNAPFARSSSSAVKQKK
ncbi:MAG: hypothetical protein HN390_04430 [Anaerolineae bacterium]|jgi:hypothetical protein|nr:hypothetical protein [Anaerolineae bacterium]MBT7189964.1 hypothetical protein [Anaerolineae bacterium]MBT7990766.1 hypothetical protein [Anaerolineae bacterium]